jgi:hypothetical protein
VLSKTAQHILLPAEVQIMLQHSCGIAFVIIEGGRGTWWNWK